MYNHNDCTFITFSFLSLSFLQYSSAVKQISKRILEEQNTGISLRPENELFNGTV